MNYQQTIDFLFCRLPMYQRIGKAAYKADLDNTIAICNSLGNPQKKFKSIHIAGTNGKGSTAHILASILQSKGLKVGLYTSPHLKDFRERIKINGSLISKKYVVGFFENFFSEQKGLKNSSAMLIEPSFFEMTVALAFNYFADNEIDIAVIETGLGGRLDSTNIITPLLSVITNIGMDHTDFLGNTLEKIAFEKAGIIKKNIPIVIGETQEETKNIFIKKAKMECSEIYFADSELEFETDLQGIYQKKNIKTALKCIEILNQKDFKLNKEHLETGLKNIVKNTGFKGRWQILSRSPLTICDVAHNAEGIKEIMEQINSMSYKTLHFVIGVVNDKDIESILRLLPPEAVYYFCKADIPRGMEQNKLANKAKKYNLYGAAYSSVKDALRNARSNAEKDDLVFIGGSMFVVAEVI